jgi:hypothetical protein
VENLGSRQPLCREGVDRSLKPVLGLPIERSKSQVFSDAVLVLEVGGLALWRVEEQNRREVELAAEVVGDPRAHDLELGQEPPVDAEDAELDGETATVPVGPTAEHLGLIVLRERPVPGEFLVGGVHREGHGIAPLSRRQDDLSIQDVLSRRHSGDSSRGHPPSRRPRAGCKWR